MKVTSVLYCNVILKQIFNLFVTSLKRENQSVQIIHFKACVSYLVSNFGLLGHFSGSVKPVTLYLFIVSLIILVEIQS